MKNRFIYIDIATATNLPSMLKGVPAVLPAHQPEIMLLQGRDAFTWVQGMFGDKNEMNRSKQYMTQPKPHGFQETSEQVQVQHELKYNPDNVMPMSMNEMGSIRSGFTDKYSFLGNDNALPNRFKSMNDPSSVMDGGQIVGDGLRDSKGISEKQKQFERDLKRLQEEREEIPNGIRRVG